jgi:hypothetical protein
MSRMGSSGADERVELGEVIAPPHRSTGMKQVHSQRSQGNNMYGAEGFLACWLSSPEQRLCQSVPALFTSDEPGLLSADL